MDKGRGTKFRKILKIERLQLCTAKYQLHWFGDVSKMSTKGVSRRIFLATPTGKRPLGGLNAGFDSTLVVVTLTTRFGQNLELNELAHVAEN